jgi:hypothetical protein
MASASLLLLPAVHVATRLLLNALEAAGLSEWDVYPIARSSEPRPRKFWGFFTRCYPAVFADAGSAFRPPPNEVNAYAPHGGSEVTALAPPLTLARTYATSVDLLDPHPAVDLRGGIVKRRILSILVAGALVAVGAAPAFGDAGPPGTTFPEQPGTNVQAACAAVTTNPGTNPTTGHSQLSPTAQAIVFSLIADACG